MASKARAYAEQARGDYKAYIASGEAGASSLGEHHRLQLLQMALEKLAKAFLYHAEPNARYSHHVALPAINRLRPRLLQPILMNHTQQTIPAKKCLMRWFFSI